MSNDSLTTLCNIGIAVFSILAILCTFGSFYFGKKATEDDQRKTSFTGAFEAVASRNFRKIIEGGQSFVQLQVGESESQVLIGAPDGKILGLDEEVGLAVSEKDGEVKLSFKIRNKNGELVAEMVDNEWELNRRNFYKRNFDNSAIEVIDNQGDVIFQIELMHDRIKLQGKLYSKTGLGIAFFSNEKCCSTIRGFDSTNANEIHIRPIFKYPSDRHFGERVKSL